MATVKEVLKELSTKYNQYARLMKPEERKELKQRIQEAVNKAKETNSLNDELVLKVEKGLNVIHGKLVEMTKVEDESEQLEKRPSKSSSVNPVNNTKFDELAKIELSEGDGNRDCDYVKMFFPKSDRFSATPQGIYKRGKTGDICDHMITELAQKGREKEAIKIDGVYMSKEIVFVPIDVPVPTESFYASAMSAICHCHGWSEKYVCFFDRNKEVPIFLYYDGKRKYTFSGYEAKKPRGGERQPPEPKRIQWKIEHGVDFWIKKVEIVDHAYHEYSTKPVIANGVYQNLHKNWFSQVLQDKDGMFNKIKLKIYGNQGEVLEYEKELKEAITEVEVVMKHHHVVNTTEISVDFDFDFIRIGGNVTDKRNPTFDNDKMILKVGAGQPAGEYSLHVLGKENSDGQDRKSELFTYKKTSKNGYAVIVIKMTGFETPDHWNDKTIKQALQIAIGLQTNALQTNIFGMIIDYLHEQNQATKPTSYDVIGNVKKDLKTALAFIKGTMGEIPFVGFVWDMFDYVNAQIAPLKKYEKALESYKKRQKDIDAMKKAADKLNRLGEDAKKITDEEMKQVRDYYYEKTGGNITTQAITNHIEETFGKILS